MPAKPSQKHYTGTPFLSILTLLSLFILFVQVKTGMSASIGEGTPVKIPILAYHNISNDPALVGDEYTVSLDNFRDQLDILQAYGYTTITLEEYFNYKSGVQVLYDKPVILTFDDGYRSMVDFVLPELLIREMVASFMIPTGKISISEAQRQDNDWSSSYKNNFIYQHMVWSEVQALANAGMEIGSHSINHYNLTDPGVDAEGEITNSKSELEHKLNIDINLFSYPYGLGGSDENLRNIVNEARYILALDYAPPDELAVVGYSDLLNLPRRAITHESSLLLNTQDPWHFFMRRLDPNFPVPNVWIDSLVIHGGDNQIRTYFHRGESANVAITIGNSNVDLIITDYNFTIYKDGIEVNWENSSQELPGYISNQSVQTSKNIQYIYNLSIPNDAEFGAYDYNFCLNGYFVDPLPWQFQAHYCSSTKFLLNTVPVIYLPLVVR